MQLKCKLLLFCLMVFSITACAVQPEVSAVAMPTVIFTATPVPPTATSSPVPTKTVEPQPESIATPLPTQPSYIITPNPAQVSQWKEYEEALSRKLFKLEENGNLSGDKFLCEWIILGAEPGKLYAWVSCNGIYLSNDSGYYTGHETKVVILIDENDSVLEIITPWDVANSYNEGVYILFPEELRGANTSLYDEMSRINAHLEYRRENPDEPPLFVQELTPSPENN